MDASEVSYLQTVKALVTGPAKPIFVNAAWFTAGVVFLMSPLSEYLQPDL